MTKPRKAVARIVAGIQCVLGGSASILAFFVYASPLVQEVLSISSGEVYLYMFLFLAFGMFSMFSGLFLVSEEGGGS